MRKFRELEIWKRSIDFCTEIYQTTNCFPPHEQFCLTNQLRRAAVSISSNIAEGCSRKSKKDFCRFLEISIGSAYEIETQLLIAGKLNYLENNLVDSLVLKIQDIIKMTAKYQSSVESSL